MIGEGVIITGTIKADNKVNILGAIDGEIDCNSLSINKTGNVKGKVKTETMTVEGKVDGEIHINSNSRLILVHRINADKSITQIATIFDGNRTDFLKDGNTSKKIK